MAGCRGRPERLRGQGEGGAGRGSRLYCRSGLLAGRVVSWISWGSGRGEGRGGDGGEVYLVEAGLQLSKDICHVYRRAIDCVVC